MEVIYFLIPLAIILLLLIVAAFFWAVKNGQFDDLEGPAYRILLDDDEQVITKSPGDSSQNENSGISSHVPEKTPDTDPEKPRNKTIL